MCDKAALRARMRAMRASSADADKSLLAVRRILALPEYADADVILAYHAVGGEVETAELIRHARADGKTVCLPAIIGRGEMEARRADRLVPGPYGIPAPEGPAFPPEAIDLIVVPGLAFDRACHRLGQGGGYYDRYLPRARGYAAGLAFEWQMVDRLPLEAHDVMVDCVATEKALYFRPEG
jgi:5-formyltetrahydrofolate cyclo-ligase